MTPPLLEVRDVEFGYDRVPVLRRVSLEIPEGGRTALLGTNGAGKSTLLRIVAGLERPDAGQIFFRGEDITREPADARARRGLVHIAGGRSVFPGLTVEQNITIGEWSGRERAPAPGQGRLHDALELFPALRLHLSRPAGTLSGGEQQMVALGRALLAAPTLLVVDELSLGLAPIVVEQVLGAVDELVSRGIALLLVEQSVNIATAVTDHAWFMERGEIRYDGPTAELLDRGDLVRSVFLGAGVERP